MAIDIASLVQDAEIPAKTQNRTKEPNPFAGMFPTGDKAKTLVLASSTDEEKKMVAKVVSQIQAAARETVTEDAPQGYTARVKREEVTQGTGKSAKPATRLTFWSTDRVFRPRKKDDAEQPTA